MTEPAVRWKYKLKSVIPSAPEMEHRAANPRMAEGKQKGCL